MDINEESEEEVMEEDVHTPSTDCQIQERVHTPSSPSGSREDIRSVSALSQASSSIDKYFTNRVNKSDFKKKVTQLFLMKNIPFNVVSSDEFHDLFRMIGYESMLPTKNEIGGKQLNVLYDAAVKENLARINKAKDVTLVFDGFTGQNNISVTTLIAHIPEPVFVKLETHEGEMKDASFYENYIEKVISEIGEDKVRAIMTDNAAPLKLAKKRISIKHENIINLGCSAHWLNRLGKDIFKLPSINNTIKDVQAIVNLFRMSSVKTEKFNREWARYIEVSKNGVCIKLMHVHLKTIIFHRANASCISRCHYLNENQLKHIFNC
jgi:hypothetical protein